MATEKLTITPNLVPEGQAAHDTAMAAAFDKAQAALAPAQQQQPAQADNQTPEEAPGRPEWLPEKFKTVEDLAAAYKALEAKLGGAAKEPVVPDANQAADLDPATADAAAAAKVVTDAGIDFDALSAEYAENGGLTQESYEKLAAKGISQQVVDTWIKGQEALVNQMRTEVFSVVGGEDHYNAMIQWAARNLSQAEIAAYNAATDGGVEAAKIAARGVFAQYVAANGRESGLVQGSQNTNSGDVFRSSAELVEAMRDPRYAKDPAYRRSVELKLGRSTVF